MTKVYFMVKKEKSVLQPCKRLKYLGNIIDSNKMIVKFQQNRKDAFVLACKTLVKKCTKSQREVAKVVGFKV